MRLIDADKITFFDCLAKRGNAVCCHAEGITCKEGIDMQPTVKAIPIDWITKYLHELDKQAEEEADFIINELGGYETCYKMEYAIGIRKMLEKWEKENELDKVQ